MDFFKRISGTKTFWGGLLAIATGAFLIAAGQYPEGTIAIIGGLQTMFVRDAIAKAEGEKNGK